MSHATPTVFVVDDDVSVRESLELLTRCAGWQPQTFASAQQFLARHDSLPRVACPPTANGIEDLGGVVNSTSPAPVPQRAAFA